MNRSKFPAWFVRLAMRGQQLAGRLRGPPRGLACMFHTGRCGSSVLGELLDRHRRVFWDSEIVFKRQTLERAPQGSIDLERLLRSRSAAAGGGVYGFELKFLPDQDPRNLTEPLGSLIDRFPSMGLDRCIVLRRRNHMRQLVSRLVGAERKSFHDLSGGGAGGGGGPTRVRLDTRRPFADSPDGHLSLVEMLDEHVERYAWLNDRLEAAGLPVLSLDFEDDISGGPAAAAERVFEFLGLGPSGVGAPRHRKTNPHPLADILENFDEVRDCLAGTPHAWMLEEQTERADAIAAPGDAGR